jgi:hypothetical protein
MWTAIHKYMEATPGISLYSYLYLKLAKTLCFSYCHSCFLFNNTGVQEGRTSSAWKQERWVRGEELEEGKEAQTMNTHVSKCKNDKK